MYKILVTIPTEMRHRELLRQSIPDAAFDFPAPDTLTKEIVHQYDIIIGNVPPQLIKGSRNLKWLQLNSAGTDGYLKDVLPEGTYLTNATGAYGLAISEHLLASLLCIMKKLNRYVRNQENSDWHDEGPVTSIYGSKTLIVGFGNIGSEFAQRMHALGSTVTGLRKNKTEKPPYLAALHQMDKFYDCLHDADIVAACLPGTPETLKLFGKEAFAAMKPGAYFLNVGRGSSVDSMALADALNSRHLAGAAIDVTDPEPLPREHPLWTAENLLITPHISGGYHLQHTHDTIISIAADNLVRFSDGKPLINIVDFSTGYRKL